MATLLKRTYGGMLFLEGHLADVPLARSLAGDRRPMSGCLARLARAFGTPPGATPAAPIAPAAPTAPAAHGTVLRGHGWAATEVSIALSSFR